jgi:adenosine deaminase/adenosine deaminase CECR1
MRQQMRDFNTNFVAKLHNDLKIDNERFTMRYQNFVLRLWNLDLFKNLVVAFISADSSPLMAGVNIVSPEDRNFHERLLVAYGNV